MAPKPTLVSALSEAVPKRQPKLVKQTAAQRRTSDESIQRQLEEHFPEKNRDETDLLRVDGMTLREKLKSIREEHDGKGRLGPAQIEQLRAQHTSTESIASKLIAEKKNDALAEELVEAMVKANAVNKARRTREPLYAYMESCTSLSQRECVGILKHLLSVNAVYPAGRTHTFRVLKHLVDLDCHVKYASYVHLLSVKFDEVLAASYSNARKHSSLQEWWEENCVYAAALPYYDVLQRVLNSDSSWGDLADDIDFLVKHTVLGKRLCERAHSHITVEQFSKRLQDEVEVLRAKPITDETLNAFKAVGEELMARAGKERDNDSRRTIEVTYRGTAVKMQVQGLRMEMTRRLGCLLKERAVLVQNGLNELEWEKHLFGPAERVAEQLDQKYLRKFSAARVFAEGLVAHEDGWTAKQILDKYNQKREFLLEKDSTFDVEISMLEWMVEEGGRKAVERAILQCMPSQGKDVTLDSAKKQLTDLRSAPLLSLLGPAELALVELAEETVYNFTRSMPPNAVLFATPGFHQDFYARFTWFLTVTVRDGNKEKTLRGEAARKHLVATRLADNYQANGYEDFHELKQFEYLCNGAEKKRLNEAVSKVRSNKDEKLATPPASKKRLAGTVAKNAKKAKCCSDEEARKAALNLFK